MSYFFDELHNELDNAQKPNLAENINDNDEHNIIMLLDNDPGEYNYRLIK